jgi:predicted phosphohydrolase
MMNKLFVSGDLHGSIDFQKLIDFNIKFGDELTKDDYIIIAGDFGVIWYERDEEEEKLLDMLDSFPWTTLFIDGNHENHVRLATFPEVMIKNARAHQISESVYHIMRGEVLEIADLKLLCIGGMDSHDKAWRTPDLDWWKEEQITEEDIANALDNAERYNDTVDYVIAHGLPMSIQRRVFPYMKLTRSAYLLDDIYYTVNIRKSWMSGHYHEDFNRKEDKTNFRLIYDDIVMLYTEEI